MRESQSASKHLNTVELQWLKHLWDMKICLRQGKFELMSINHSTRSGGITGIFFSIFFNMKIHVCCVF